MEVKEKDFLDKLNDMNNRVQEFQKSFASRTPKYLRNNEKNQMTDQIRVQLSKL
jgi:hypothetical protein